MLEALIWDVDGTLVDSEELHRIAFNAAFKEYGLNWDWTRELYGFLLEVTGGKERIRFFLKWLGIDEETLPASVEEIHARKTEIYKMGILNGELPLRNRVGEVIASARERGIRLAIATTTSLSNVEALFESKTLNRDDWEVVVAGDQVKNKKPDPEVYLEALRRLSLGPKQCLAIEDSECGLAAAVGAELPTIITPNAYTINQSFDDALVLVKKNNDGTHNALDYLEAWHATVVDP